MPETELLVFCGTWLGRYLVYDSLALDPGRWPPSLNGIPDNPTLDASVCGNKSPPPPLTLTLTLTLTQP